MEEQQTWGMEEEETWGIDEKVTSEVEEEKTWRKEEEQTLEWRKKKLLFTSLTTSTPVSLLALYPLLSRINLPFFIALKHDQRGNCAKKKIKIQKTVSRQIVREVVK